MPIKKVLLTNLYLQNFAGTEINSLSIAKEFKRQNYEVELATFVFNDPIAPFFEEANIPVINLYENEIVEKHYDLIFANHFPVLTRCLTTAKISADKILFVSNSSFAPVEAPPEYINNLTYCLVVSNFLIPQLEGYGVQPEKIKLFPNFLTEEEIVLKGSPGKQLKRLAVISNHVPEVVYQAAEILRERGIHIDIYGVRDTYKLLSAQDLLPYDGIVSIGKSVYWALGIGIPAFCFDHFGGPGWINKENISTAFDFTFSGKGFDPVFPSPEQLADQIQNGYPQALTSIAYCQNFIETNCRLSTNIEELLKEVENKPKVENPLQGFSKDALERRNQGFVTNFRLAVTRADYAKRLNDAIVHKNAIIVQKDNLIAEKNSLIAESNKLIEEKDNLIAEKDKLIAHKDSLIEEKNNLINEMANTRGWKMLVNARKRLGAPYQWLKSLFKKLK